MWVLCIPNPMATLYLFLGPIYKHFGGSLHSKPLHRLELLSFFGNTWQQLLSWQHFFCFFYLYINIFVVSSWHSKPQRRLELPWQHSFLFLELINNLMDSLHSLPLHGLELIRFSAITCNKCCHDITFFLFLGLTNIFMGSLHSIPLHRLELIRFSAVPGNYFHYNTFFLVLGCGYKQS